MEIGDWRGTRDLNDIYRELRGLGLESNVAELDAFGFTIVEDALDPELCQRLRGAVIHAAEKRFGKSFDLEGETELENFELVPYLLFKDRAFEEALLNPRPLALVTYLMGRSCLLSSMASHVKGPGGFGIPLHSDTANGFAAPFSPYSHVCNCNYALTDYTQEGGALALVPGSHRQFRQPTRHEFMVHGEQRNPGAIPIEVPAGTAILWHGNTWHGSYPRSVPGLRINLSLYFCRQHIQPQENYRDHLPDEIRERHGPDSRFATLMGKNTHYGWTDEGPQMEKLARPVGRSWHA